MIRRVHSVGSGEGPEQPSQGEPLRENPKPLGKTLARSVAATLTRSLYVVACGYTLGYKRSPTAAGNSGRFPYAVAVVVANFPIFSLYAYARVLRGISPFIYFYSSIRKIRLHRLHTPQSLAPVGVQCSRNSGYIAATSATSGYTRTRRHKPREGGEKRLWRVLIPR